VWEVRADGAFAIEVDAQLSAAGSYRPPVLRYQGAEVLVPPHTIISLPVQTAACPYRASGAFVEEIGAQLSDTGSYRPPVFR
jgi:hypothetical protein